jgi:hypothetical protein
MPSNILGFPVRLLIADFRSEKLLWTGSAIGMVFVATCLFGTLWILDYIKLEKAIPYTISAPNPPGDGRVLEKPTIKVREP